jgi:hypothetical protein
MRKLPAVARRGAGLQQLLQLVPQATAPPQFVAFYLM